MTDCNCHQENGAKFCPIHTDDDFESGRMTHTPAQIALLSYMEHASEERWCAGWLTGLHEALIGDTTYEWLIEQAGGYWMWPTDELDEPIHTVNGMDLIWMTGSPGHKDPLA